MKDGELIIDDFLKPLIEIVEEIKKESDEQKTGN